MYLIFRSGHHQQSNPCHPLDPIWCSSLTRLYARTCWRWWVNTGCDRRRTLTSSNSAPSSRRHSASLRLDERSSIHWRPSSRSPNIPRRPRGTASSELDGTLSLGAHTSLPGSYSDGRNWKRLSLSWTNSNASSTWWTLRLTGTTGQTCTTVCATSIDSRISEKMNLKRNRSSLTMTANHRWQAKWCTLESLQSTLLQTHEPEPQHAANPPPLQTMFIVNSNVERLHVWFVVWFTCDL